jgi:hypothetical protein
VRQALREQATACERAKDALREARATIQTLETKLAHERFGKDEALRRLEDELAAERTARTSAIVSLDPSRRLFCQLARVVPMPIPAAACGGPPPSGWLGAPGCALQRGIPSV